MSTDLSAPRTASCLNDSPLPNLGHDLPADFRSPGFSTTSFTKFFRNCGVAVQTLSIYGALGIVSFGWTLSRLLHFDCGRYVPLWFCSALFIYNLDRLKKDPADAINTPVRSHNAASLREVSRGVTIVSAAALVIVPAIEQDWLMLLLTTVGALVCANYSVPILGFRFKNVPFLKSFFAPTLVTAAFVLPPLLQQPHRTGIECCMMVTGWTWCVTLFNMIICDLRDMEGDASTGIRSLPVAIGHRRTILLLCGLLLLSLALSIIVQTGCEPAQRTRWIGISIIMPLYLAGLLLAMRRPRAENFYEWWVEGILLVPAVAYSILSLSNTNPPIITLLSIS